MDNGKCRMQNAEMQNAECRMQIMQIMQIMQNAENAESVRGKCECCDWSRCFVENPEGRGCLGCGEVMGFGVWMGGRFSVDLGSKACDRERRARCRLRFLLAEPKTRGLWPFLQCR